MGEDTVANEYVGKYKMDEAAEKRIDNNFTYHAPKPDQPKRYEAIRDFGGEFARHLCVCCPPSRELSLALTHLEDAVMWANAAIARNE